MLASVSSGSGSGAGPAHPTTACQYRADAHTAVSAAGRLWPHQHALLLPAVLRELFPLSLHPQTGQTA